MVAGVLALLAGGVFLLAQEWLAGAVMLMGGVGFLAAFRRGTWDRQVAKEQAKDYAMPRLVGAAVGLGVFIVVAAVGLLD